MHRMMKPLILGAASAIALSLSPIAFGTLPIPLVAADQAEAASTVNIDIFFQPLASHGVWVKHPKYHYVFCPKVDAKWRPYSHGHWIYMKNYGWYFASDEPFAWAVYHYGRWFRDDKVGWCWVPGNAWAGAWVAWRRGNDYVGWAPLPPDRDGYAVDVDVTTAEPPQPDWIFIPPKQFLQPRLSTVVVFGDDHPDVFQKTKFVGPVVVQNNIVVNNVIDINFIQQQTNTKVTVVEPKPVNDPGQAAADASGNTIAVFAPQIAKPQQTEAPKQSVDEQQAQQQIGNGASSAEASSSASSGEMSSASSGEVSSSAAASGASSSEASSSMASSASGEPSSSAASSASASEQPSSSASAPASSSAAVSSSAAAPVSSSAEPVSSSSSVEPSSSAAPKAAPVTTATTASSSSEAPAVSSSSVEPKAASSEAPAPASSSVEPKASSAEPSSAPKKTLICPEGEELVKGKCVPIASSTSTSPCETASSAAL
jgi:hypothetical protein